MKTLSSRLFLYGRILMFVLLILAFASCGKETLDFNNPDVELFVKQLKNGNYSVEGSDGLSKFPRFTQEDIDDLLKYADDLTVIPAFPLAPVSYSAGGKLRLGECILWTVETIRLGHNASMGCKWYVQMPKIMKESISFRMKKFWTR